MFIKNGLYTAIYGQSLSIFHRSVILLFLVVLVACDSGDTKVNQEPAPSDTASTEKMCIDESKTYVSTNIGRASIRNGGLGYDKWWAEYRSTEPLVDHDLWATQSTNIRTGSVTWRCKECHGWDYLGKNGAYNATNSHFTGFIGVMGAKGKNPTEVFCAIKSKDKHQFSEVMTDNEILDITAFIVDFGGRGDGIIDYNDLLDVNNISIGDGTVGGQGDLNYNDNNIGGCGSGFCHGSDGSKKVGNAFSIGDLALDNPWEVLHKIRYGQPNKSMPSSVVDTELSLLQISDILAYAQLQLSQDSTGGGAEGDFIRGGLLYDDWPTLLTAEGSTEVQPTSTMPLFKLLDTTMNTSTGLGTWRCKECHGWDYKGKDGQYGDPTSSHYTGFPGILETKNDPEVTATFLLNFLKNGYGLPQDVTYHKFSPYLTDSDLIQLVSFIQTGVIETNPYISTTPPVVGIGKGEAIRGNFLYSFNINDTTSTVGCSRCHEVNGKKIDFDPDPVATEYINDLALSNPWEVLHKIRFGQPSSIGLGNLEMLGTLKSGFTNGDAADILTYTQNLPQ